MPLILSIDTSTRGCSVALHQDQTLVSCYELFTDKSSSSMLTTLMQNVVEQAGFKLSALDAVAVGKGPGSYTGLRIAVSTAKGLCFALDKPLIAINTLQGMAAQIQGFFEENTLLCPMIDARRMEVFCAVFDNNLNFISPTQAKIIDETAFDDILENHKMIFFGDGAAKCKPALQHNPNAIFLPRLIYPSARTVGFLAKQSFDNQAFEDIETFEPYYLKDFIGTVSKK